jgi:hypothetical protein
MPLPRPLTTVPSAFRVQWGRKDCGDVVHTPRGVRRLQRGHSQQGWDDLRAPWPSATARMPRNSRHRCATGRCGWLLHACPGRRLTDLTALTDSSAHQLMNQGTTAVAPSTDPPGRTGGSWRDLPLRIPQQRGPLCPIVQENMAAAPTSISAYTRRSPTTAVAAPRAVCAIRPGLRAPGPADPQVAAPVGAMTAAHGGLVAIDGVTLPHPTRARSSSPCGRHQVLAGSIRPGRRANVRAAD